MEMYQIRYAIAAAKTLNFTKAAGECNVSQPALTKAIKTLETELGSNLFHREGRRVALSEFGRSMLPHFQSILDEAEVTRSLAESYRLLNHVPVRIGIMSSIGHVRASRFLAEFQKTYGGVEVAVTENRVGDLKEKLRAGELDVAILNPLDGLGEEFTSRRLYSEKYIVVLPPEHRLGEFNGVKLTDLSGEPYVDRLACEVRDKVIGICDELGVELYARFRSEREDWVQAMVLARIGFAFMPEYSVTLPGLIQRPLVEPSVERTIALVTVPGRPHTPAVSTFVRAAQAFQWPG